MSLYFLEYNVFWNANVKFISISMYFYFMYECFACMGVYIYIHMYCLWVSG